MGAALVNKSFGGGAPCPQAAGARTARTAPTKIAHHHKWLPQVLFIRFCTKFLVIFSCTSILGAFRPRRFPYPSRQNSGRSECAACCQKLRRGRQTRCRFGNPS